MRTPICDRLGIEFPLFAFSHCRDVVAAVDAAARNAGRDPAAIGRTAAVYVQLPSGRGRHRMTAHPPRADPICGGPDEIAEGLAAFGRVGVSHLQVVLDPITLDAIEAFSPVLQRMDGMRA